MRWDYDLTFCLVLLSLVVGVPLLGRYMAIIFNTSDSKNSLTRLEGFIYRIAGIDPAEEMAGKRYLRAFLCFNLVGFIFLMALLMLQGFLPLNPQNFSGVDPFLAFNTAMSFVTNTDWQAYGGENTLSYLSQMMGLGVQNFLSAASGNAVLLALIRGLKSRPKDKETAHLGNFWVDVTRTTLYLLIPLSLIFAVAIVGRGSIQNFSSYIEAHTLEGETQLLPMGPVASQIAIKQLGSNGGGYFNANSMHPFENPTPFTNILETIAILLIPAATVRMYGIMVGSKRHGWLLLGVMILLWGGGLLVANMAESMTNPVLQENPVWEGKETRLGSTNSILWTVSTTSTGNGSTNSAISSLSPIAGGVALFNILLGEVIFGGMGEGLCSMLMFVFLAVFLAGLMVGRTPEYLGKKVGKAEMIWVMLAILAPCALILSGVSLALILEKITNLGPHGLTELLYAFASTSGNNGSAFAGFEGNTPFYNTILGLMMLIGRLSILVPGIAVGASLARRKAMAVSHATLPTNSLLFASFLIAVLLIVAALTFMPALMLGPIVEQFLMIKGYSYN